MTAPDAEESDGMPEILSTTLLSPEESAKKLAASEKLARLTLMAIIVLSIIGVASVVTLFIIGKGDAATTVLTFLSPTIAGLLAYRKSNENSAAIHELHLSVDGRLSQLLKTTKVAAKAEGVAQGTADRQFRATDTQSPNDSTRTSSIDTGPTSEESALP